MQDDLHTLAEIAIGIMGFTGIVIVLAPSRLHGFDRERFIYLIIQSALILIFCFLPSVVRELALHQAGSQRVLNSLLAAVLALVYGRLPMVYLRTGPQDTPYPLGVMVVVLSVAAVTVAALILSATPIAMAFAGASFLAALLLLLVTSLMSFFGLLISLLKEDGSPES